MLSSADDGAFMKENALSRVGTTLLREKMHCPASGRRKNVAKNKKGHRMKSALLVYDTMIIGCC